MQLISHLAAAGLAISLVGFTAPTFAATGLAVETAHIGDALLAASGKGRGKPEDNGIDNPDACDDNGVDGACRMTRRT
ncbi:MAG: hypothetical protein SFW09_10730 [Hyphomicrobiaceae bacterium]|nr:hypothetical protein [Hyphomicrobiaceae bacterium]